MDGETMEMRMPASRLASDEADVYLCTAFDMPPRMHSLTHVLPHAKQEVVHHMMLFGCDEPKGAPGEVWTCHGHDICAGPSQTLYGWGKDARGLELPPDAGFAIGPGTQIPKIVVQVHYLVPRPDGDTSGVDVRLAPAVQPSTVSLLVFAPYFTIPPRVPAHNVSAQCCYEGFQPLRGVAFRVHTHDLGENVALDRSPVPWDSPLADSLTERIAERSPQLPQMFQAVQQPAPIILPGHHLKSTCLFNSSTRSMATASGWTHDDEMCNIYYMVHSEQAHFGTCGNTHMLGPTERLPGAVAVAMPLPVIEAGRSGALPPLGPISGVAVSPLDGTLWLLARHDTYWGAAFFARNNTVTSRRLIPQDTVYQVDPLSGAVLQSWGAATFSMPHGISVDWEGNVWVTDVGRHQVLQFTRDGAPLLTLGTAFVSGSTARTFCKPTDVAPQPDGSVLISDGYCNSRVLAVPGPAAARDDGMALEALELAVAGGVPGQALMHSVAVNGCREAVLIADRERGVVHTVNTAQQTAAWESAADMFGLNEVVKVWAVRTGPRGDTYMLLQTGGDWEHGAVYLACKPHRAPIYLAQLQDVAFPHDFAFATLPVEHVTTAVPVVVYVTETPTSSSRIAHLHRFVLAEDGWSRKPVSHTAQASAAAGLEEGPRVADEAATSIGASESASSGAARPLAGAKGARPKQPQNLAQEADPDPQQRLPSALERRQFGRSVSESALSGMVHSVYFQGGVATGVLSVAAVLLFGRSRSTTQPYSSLTA